MKVDQLFKMQQAFNNLIYPGDLTKEEKEEITKTLSLCLHSEVSSMISSINFKDHRPDRVEVDKSKILYESIDAMRYILSILNLWEIDSESFCDAFAFKDTLLHVRHRIHHRKWEGQPVIIVDLDDVLIEFRAGFMDWLETKYGVKIDRNSSEYYTASEVIEAGLNPESVFDTFIEEKNLLSLDINHKMLEIINRLHDEGVWIQILTARPKENLTCFYHTLMWIERAGLKYDRIDFSPEKYRWCAQSEYFNDSKISFAIDDSAKHASEYAKHGIKVLVPVKSYNTEVHNSSNIVMYDEKSPSYEQIKHMINT